MKKIIIIYLLGVILSWGAGFGLLNKWKNEYNTKWTCGDVTFVTIFSLFSWLNLTAVTIVYIGDLEFWDKPINQ